MRDRVASSESKKDRTSFQDRMLTEDMSNIEQVDTKRAKARALLIRHYEYLKLTSHHRAPKGSDLQNKIKASVGKAEEFLKHTKENKGSGDTEPAEPSRTSVISCLNCHFYVITEVLRNSYLR
jgi:hypothetical protein